MTQQKKRHGCLTAWLILAMIVNALGTIALLLANTSMREELAVDVPGWSISVALVLAATGLVCYLALFYWQKWGFWGLLVAYTAGLVIDLSSGYSIGEALRNMLAMAILYGVLQIGGENSGWSQLE